jgi:ankyrin repeat protein
MSMLVVGALNSDANHAFVPGFTKAKIVAINNKDNISYFNSAEKQVEIHENIFDKSKSEYADHPWVILHEITHMYHYMLVEEPFYRSNNYLSMYYGVFDSRINNFLLVYGVLNSKRVDFSSLFFPMLAKDRMGKIVGIIGEYIRRNGLFGKIKQNKSAVTEALRTITEGGFANLVLPKTLSNLKVDEMLTEEILARLIYVWGISYNGTKIIWTDGEEMLTIIGILPIQMEDRLYIIEDRQSEEIYKIRQKEKNESIDYGTYKGEHRFHTLADSDYMCRGIEKRIRELSGTDVSSGFSTLLKEAINGFHIPKNLRFHAAIDTPTSYKWDTEFSDEVIADLKKRKETIEGIASLFSSIRKGHVEELKAGNIEALVDELGPDIQDHISGDTLLQLVAGHGDIEIVEMLLRKEANPNLINNFGNTALHFAVEYGHIEIVEMLLRKGANPNITSSDGAPLHRAAENNNIKAIEALLDNGETNPNIKDLSGNTPLHRAVRRNNVEAVKALSANDKTDPRIIDANGRTPLQLAENLKFEPWIENTPTSEDNQNEDESLWNRKEIIELLEKKAAGLL